MSFCWVTTTRLRWEPQSVTLWLYPVVSTVSTVSIIGWYAVRQRVNTWPMHFRNGFPKVYKLLSFRSLLFGVTCILGIPLTDAHSRKIKIYKTLALILNFSILQIHFVIPVGHHFFHNVTKNSVTAKFYWMTLWNWHLLLGSCDL